MQIHERDGSQLPWGTPNGSEDPDPLSRALRNALRLCADVLPAEAGAIVLGPQAELVRASVAFGNDAKRLVNGHGGRVSGWLVRCIDRGSVQLVRDPKTEPYFTASSASRTRSSIAAALALGEPMVGAVTLTNPKAKTHFDAHDKKTLRALAKQVSSSLQDAASLALQQHLALHDPLTGLRNIRQLDEDIVSAVRVARRNRLDVAVMFLDVDRLKRINSRLGHAAGSEALRRTAQSLQETMADGAVAYRFGGDEFVVVYTCEDEQHAHASAETMRAHIAAYTEGPMRQGGSLPKVTVSVGIATMRSSVRHERARPKTIVTKLLGAADRAVFRAKASGRNRVVMATRAETAGC